MKELAPAKINLCLLVGPVRADGRHELVSLMQSISLFDEVEIASGDLDCVVCEGVEGPNLVEAAIGAFRRTTGWDGPGQRVTITKRIPVAAGLAGGSADAAAALRLLARRSGLGDEATLLKIASRLGSDVPSQLRPGRCVVRGRGEVVEALADLDNGLGVVVVPSPARLSTAAVYAEADRLRLPRSPGELAALDPLACVGVNDLQAAAISLEPTIREALERVERAGAKRTLVSGSGPTVIGLFDQPEDAEHAAAKLRATGLPAAVAATPFAAAAT